MVTLIATVSVMVLAIVLVAAQKIDALRGTPRSRWLSFAGGVAVGYVFLKLLLEVTRAQQKLMEHHASPGWLGEHQLFLVALAGAIVLFGIERAAKQTKRDREARGEEPRSATWVFALHAVLMAFYTAMIGYMFFREGEQHVRDVSVFGVVMALHFSGIAVALADDYRSLYSRWGRWILAVAVLAGGGVGYGMKLPETAVHLLLGVIAGTVICSVIKEEIPPEQQSSFWAAAAGAATAVALLWIAG